MLARQQFQQENGKLDPCLKIFGGLPGEMEILFSYLAKKYILSNLLII